MMALAPSAIRQDHRIKGEGNGTEQSTFSILCRILSKWHLEMGKEVPDRFHFFP